MGAHEDVKDKMPSLEGLSQVNVTYTCSSPDILLEMQGTLENYREFVDVRADLVFNAADHQWRTRNPAVSSAIAPRPTV